jgi:hypothetical protein
MTKEQFLSGAFFYIKGKKYKGDSTYNFNGAGSISRQSRSSVDERVVIDDYECNIFKLGRVGFEGFTFVMGKKVVVKVRFKDLVPFEDQGPEYDGAGFSIEDREEDPEELTHHCDDPSCNCSI